MTEAKSTPAKKAPAKKPKPPALEDKPFAEFMEQHFLPALSDALAKSGLTDVTLKFVEQALPITGSDASQQYWQVEGIWDNGNRQFNLYFFDATIKGPKGFSYATDGRRPSTLESFMIDEKKITLNLLVLYILQRLNSQKWLSGN